MTVSHFEFQHGFWNIAAGRSNGERICDEEEPENEASLVQSAKQLASELDYSIDQKLQILEVT